jgi:transcription termination factor NusB
MQVEIEDVQRKSEMDVIRQRKKNQDLQEQSLAMQQEILNLLQDVKDKQNELKEEIVKQNESK